MKKSKHSIVLVALVVTAISASSIAFAAVDSANTSSTGISMTGEPSTPMSVGFELGVGSANYSAGSSNRATNAEAPDLNAKAGLSLGITANYAFTDVFGVQSGLRFSNRGFGLPFAEAAVPGDITVSTNYLEIPLMARVSNAVTHVVRPFVSAGPTLMIRTGKSLSATAEVNGRTADVTIPEKEEAEFLDRLELRTLVLGMELNAGSEFWFNERLGAVASFRYTQAITNEFGLADASLRTRQFSLVAGMNYRL